MEKKMNESINLETQDIKDPTIHVVLIPEEFLHKYKSTHPSINRIPIFTENPDGSKMDKIHDIIYFETRIGKLSKVQVNVNESDFDAIDYNWLESLGEHDPDRQIAEYMEFSMISSYINICLEAVEILRKYPKQYNASSAILVLGVGESDLKFIYNTSWTDIPADTVSVIIPDFNVAGVRDAYNAFVMDAAIKMVTKKDLTVGNASKIIFDAMRYAIDYTVDAIKHVYSRNNSSGNTKTEPAGYEMHLTECTKHEAYRKINEIIRLLVNRFG